MARRKRKRPGKRKSPRKASASRENLHKYRKVSGRTSYRRRAAPNKRKAKRRLKRQGLSPRLDLAVKELNRGRSLTATARSFGLSSKTLKEQLKRKRLLQRKGKRWVTQDNRLRRVKLITGGRFRELVVRGYKLARLAGKYHHAAGQFVRTNDLRLLKPFRGRTVQAANGRRYVLETDPNALHRIAAMDSPRFHEIHAITSNT